MLSIGKIERKKSYMLIVEQIKQLILDGELKIGEKLPPRTDISPAIRGSPGPLCAKL